MAIRMVMRRALFCVLINADSAVLSLSVFLSVGDLSNEGHQKAGESDG